MRTLGILFILVIVGGGSYLGWLWSPSETVVGDWQAFKSNGGDFEDPSRWDVADPHDNPKEVRGLSWLRETPPDGCHVALLRAPDLNMEILLIYGPEAKLQPLVDRAEERFDSGPVNFVPVDNMTTLDGLELECKQVYITAGPFGGNDMTFFIGHGANDGNLLIISAGSEQRGFDFDTVWTLVRSLEVPSGTPG